GIFNDSRGDSELPGATLTINHCTISGNSGFLGGGIRSSAIGFNHNATISVNFSTITGNLAIVVGGGISIAASSEGSVTLNIHAWTIRGNSVAAGDSTGGGINADGADRPLHVLVSNSTLSGNSAASTGAAIFTRGDGIFQVEHCTVTDNSAPLVGGIEG